MLNTSVVLRLDIFIFELNIAAVQHSVLWGGNVNESGFHTGKNVLDTTQINISVNLTHVIGRTADVVLNQAAAFHDGHLSDAISDLNTHLITADRATIALAALTALDDFGIHLGCIANGTIARP